MRPAVSVVMPAYNTFEWVNYAIMSIVNQTFEDWELIIVDDGSDDEEIRHRVRIFDDPRIRYFRTEHKGLVHARNFGNSKARADIIAVQDSDDVSLPDRLEKCLPHMKDCDILFHGLYVNIWNDVKQCMAREYIPALEPDKERILKEQYMPGVTMFHKRVWEEKPYRMETKHAFDWMTWLDWIYAGFKIKALDLGLYEYIRRESSSSIKYERDGRRKESMLKIKDIMKKEHDKEVTIF